MVTLVAPKLEVSFLQALDNKELLVVPVVVVFLKETGEGSLVRPLNADPLEGLLLRSLHNLILDGQFAVYIVFNLLNGGVALFLTHIRPVLLVGQRHLEPVCHFKNVSGFKVLVMRIAWVIGCVQNWGLINRLHILPLENLLI